MNKSIVFQYAKWTLVAVLGVTGCFEAMAAAIGVIAGIYMVNDVTSSAQPTT